MPSSEEKDPMGDSVPEVKTIQRVWEPISEKTLKQRARNHMDAASIVRKHGQCNFALVHSLTDVSNI